MRSVLTTGGIPTFVGSREWDFLEEQFAETSTVYKQDLNEQQAEMAKILAGRGVLQRFRDDLRGIYYTKNQNKGII